MEREYLEGKLTLPDVEKILARLENRLDILERATAGANGRMRRNESFLEHLGRDKKRTEDELTLMDEQVWQLLQTTDEVVGTLESNEAIEQAKALRRRLRNNLTRIKALLPNIAG